MGSPDRRSTTGRSFLPHNLWVTAYDPAERFPAGKYPYQSPGAQGLPSTWPTTRRSDRDLVVWYTFGAHHILRPEDWPVMPVAPVGFMLRPDGFFDRNPALDLPPSAACHAEGHGNGASC